MTTEDLNILSRLIQNELKGVIHKCTQIDKIEAQDNKIGEVHKIVVGNGDPEKSLCRQVALIAERQGNVLTELKEIKDRRKATPQAIINWVSLGIGFVMMGFAYFSLHAGQKDMQSSQDRTEIKQDQIQENTKATNDLFTPDSTQQSIVIRGPVYIPVLKTDSANVVRSKKLDEMADKLLK